MIPKYEQIKQDLLEELYKNNRSKIGIKHHTLESGYKNVWCNGQISVKQME